MLKTEKNGFIKYLSKTRKQKEEWGEKEQG
jgi:hypothetical protein